MKNKEKDVNVKLEEWKGEKDERDQKTRKNEININTKFISSNKHNNIDNYNSFATTKKNGKRGGKTTSG